jgi:hypothetical protein
MNWNCGISFPYGVCVLPCLPISPSFFPSTVKIEGVVWLNHNADGVRDEQDEGVPGVSVVLKKDGMAYDMNKHIQIPFSPPPCNWKNIDWNSDLKKCTFNPPPRTSLVLSLISSVHFSNNMVCVCA